MTKSVKNNGLYTASLIDRFFSWLKKTAYNNFLETNEKWFTKIGLTLMYFIAVMSLLVAIVFVLKYNALSTFYVLTAGICGVFITIVFQYIAAKTIPCLNTLIHNTPAKFSSTAILEVLALAAGICGVIALIGGLVISINASSLYFFISGIAIFVICEYWMAMAMKPELLNIEIVKNISAGEEFIGLLTFFAKGSLKIIPVIFCGCMIFAAYDLIAMMFVKYNYIGEINLEAGIVAYAMCGALLPLFGYVSFLGYYFTIDIARAILSIPAKLDKK